jgi:hypothetical protein
MIKSTFTYLIHQDAVLDILAFHDRVSQTGLTPSQTFPQMMCEEFFGCTKDLQEDKKLMKKHSKPSNKGKTASNIKKKSSRSNEDL